MVQVSAGTVDNESMAIKDTAKPNTIAASTAGFGEAQPEATGWNTAAPTSEAPATQDNYSPQMVGGDDHNSDWLMPTAMD